MLTTFYPPENFGGDGIAIQRLARSFVRRGHSVCVIHDADSYNLLSGNPGSGEGDVVTPARLPFVPTMGEDGVEVCSLETGHSLIVPLLTQQTGRPVVNAARLRGLIDSFAPHVILYNNISLIGGPGILDFGSAVKILEAHEHWLVCPTHVLWRYNRELCDRRKCIRCTLSYRRPPQLWRYTGYLQRKLANVDVFIAKSEFSRAKHHEFGFPREMEVVPYFLPEIEVSSADQRSSRAPQERPYFLFAGRLTANKGLDDVIPAMAAVPAADLLIAGEGEMGAAWRQLAAGLSNVRFLGRLDQTELGRYNRHALASIVSSIGYETFGITLIEALRSATPVLARRLGTYPELLGDSGAGLLFGSTGEMVEAMRNLVADPLARERMSRAARTLFEEKWTEDAVVPRYLSIIEREAGRKGREDILQVIRREAA